MGLQAPHTLGCSLSSFRLHNTPTMGIADSQDLTLSVNPEYGDDNPGSHTVPVCFSNSLVPSPLKSQGPWLTPYFLISFQKEHLKLTTNTIQVSKYCSVK